MGVRLFLSLFAVSRRFSLRPSCHLAVAPFSSFFPLSLLPLSRRSPLPRSATPPPPAGPLFSRTCVSAMFLHRGTGAGSASRHGGGLGRVHPHDRVPGIPLSYRTKLHPAARGQARASYWLRSPSSPAPDKGQRQARSTVDSLFHWRSLSTSDLPPASHWQSLTITGTLTEAAKAHAVGGRGGDRSLPRCGLR